MITKLKAEQGFDYTNKFTRMFQGELFFPLDSQKQNEELMILDVSLSRDLTERFKEKERSQGISSDRK
jgi:hypothetical protein